MKLKFLTFCGTLIAFTLSAEPWIDTRDQYLRADIELLADIGVIKVPITTYPLMWSGVIESLDHYDLDKLPREYRAVYWRVKNAGNKALGLKRQRILSISAGSAESAFRQFGSELRGSSSLNARQIGLTDRFAWNAEIHYVDQSTDENDIRLDGSYAAVIIGNWVLAAGEIEKWWGASWESSNLLSNNARPPLGLMLQRNYSNPTDEPVIKYIGPWTFNSFVAELDEKRFVKDTKLIGASFSFKPHDTLEVALRATALWGGRDNFGDGRLLDESFSSVFDVVLGNQQCEAQDIDFVNFFYEYSELLCDGYYSASGDRRGGIDIRWRLPIDPLKVSPVTIYASHYSERESGFISNESVQQVGITSSFNIGNSQLTWFIESSETLVNDTGNVAYENSVYRNGYRYKNRSLGSTLDNDSKALTFGAHWRLNRQHQVSINIFDYELNVNSGYLQEEHHSLTQETAVLAGVRMNWNFETQSYGNWKISAEHFEEKFDFVDTLMNISWTQKL